MDELFITVLSGVANGAVYGLVGLGLVIIFQSTDVMNFAMAAMATTASYVALSVYDAGLALALALVVAVFFASAFGLVVREVLIRPLGEGRLFAALVVTMGVAISVEHFVGRHWGEQPRAFPGWPRARCSWVGRGSTSRTSSSSVSPWLRWPESPSCSVVRRSGRPCEQ